MENMTPQFRQRLLDAALRNLRIRRAILELAGRAAGHPIGCHQICRACHAAWPCEPVKQQASAALAALEAL